MCVLVPKVQDKNTKGLDENLLRDFIFAGMNCPGFGERQKHELLWAAGYWGAAIDNPPLRYFWPFDLLGWQDGIDAETVKVGWCLGSEKTARCAHNFLVLSPSC